MQGQREQFDVLPDGVELLDKTLHVAPSAKGSPAAGDHDDPHRCILAAGDDRIVEFGGQLHVEGVIGFRSIERDRRDAITDIEEDLRIAHGLALLLWTAAPPEAPDGRVLWESRRPGTTMPTATGRPVRPRRNRASAATSSARQDSLG